MDNNEFQKIVTNELKEIANELKENRKFQKDVMEELKSLKTQTKENTDMLKALIHASEKHKADIDRLELQGAKTQGEVVALRNDLKFVQHQSAENCADIIELKTARA